ncbi:MAG TPA: GntR family transcriptional regulator [Gaiellaceae bacterium]|nr:GntR family transcriptional regulator [Gaiellaceae bacterium]
MADLEPTADAKVTGRPRRVLLADDSYRILREALIANRLAPGERLNIEQLAEDMQVSITPIRHALVRLEADGLVTREPYKGYVVSRMLDPSAVSDIFEARLLIESELVARTAVRATKADVEELARLASHEPMSETAPGGDPDGPLDYDGAFHELIAKTAGNAVLVDTIDALFKRMSAYRSFRVQVLESKWSPSGEFDLATKREHTAIVRAIRQGDPAAAQAAMRKHLENARRRDTEPIPDGS